MADFADESSDLTDFELKIALGNRSNDIAESEHECTDCGDEIPEQRRSIGGVTRCIGCQTVF